MFGEMVRAHRRRLGLTQAELAERTGLSVRGIGKLEAGRIAAPRPVTVRLLADVFGLAGAERDRFCESAAESTPDRPGGGAATPAQLPADVFGFTGREEQLARLDALMTGAADRPAAVVISLIAGPAGVGKTALAIHWAHRLRGLFPDGQLYVDLRGYDPDQPVTAADALARFLTAVGVAGTDIPLEVDERATRYRTEVAGRRMLIVLDNAATVEQVRPLLPGTGTCAVVVTSRDSLAGLVSVHGAHRFDLDLLPPADAYALMHRLIGGRVDAESEATATIAALCVRLPLALRVAAELAISRPASTLAHLADELTDQRQRLDLLDASGDPRAAVTAVFSWSIRQLPAEAARAFRLLGLHPGADLDVYAAAALTDTAPAQARRMLHALVRAHLVHLTAEGRYGMHDLLRAYAVRLAQAEEPDADRADASGRLFDHYLSTAATAMDALYPAEAHHRPRVAPPATPIPAMTDPATARAWLDAERQCLVTVVVHTATHGWHTHAVRLSTILYRYLDGGYPAEALVVHTHGVAAGRRGHDPQGQAQALLGLGLVHVQLGRYELAEEHLQQALTLFQQGEDQVGPARALGNLGIVSWRLSRYDSAAAHLTQALLLYRQAGDRTGEANALSNLGVTEQQLCRYESAADHHQQALILFQKTEDSDGEAMALTNLGEVEALLGRYGQAADHHQEALAIYRKLGNVRGEAWALLGLATVDSGQGRHERAVAQHEQALAIFRDIGQRDCEAWALNGLGEAAHAAGESVDAVAPHTQALALAVETGARDQEARAHAGLGHAHHALGNATDARLHYELALNLFTDLGMPDADNVRTRLAGIADVPPPRPAGAI